MVQSIAKSFNWEEMRQLKNLIEKILILGSSDVINKNEISK